MAILEVNNLKKRFGAIDVLKGVSFSLEQGQVLAIIGSKKAGPKANGLPYRKEER